MLCWSTIEKNIYKEIEFLSKNLLLSPYEQNDAIKCSDCIFRQIAILIVSGKIKIKKIIYKNNSIWLKHKQLKIVERKQHGGDWHNSLIGIIDNYFKDKGYITKYEPNIHYGRADLGVPDLDIFIEVGTINLYKLYYNINNMINSKILILPSDNYLIEISL